MISWFEKNSKISWLITLAIAVTIFYVSSLTFLPGKLGGSNLKSVLYHFSVFFVLAIFLLISLIKRKNIKFLPIALVILILYAISDELHQVFVPGRACALEDIFTDTAGIIFAFLIYSIRIITAKKSK
ncbi:VanZ family protein [Candidatus Pacearchaeota archaeon]|nr:VanZ family protein [Candidatus Pacearchaeota archaeon]